MGKYDRVNIDRAIQEGGKYFDNFSKLSVVKSCRIVEEEDIDSEL